MSLRMSEIAELRRRWGNKPCNHPDYTKEREDKGGKTGDYVCTQCGKTFLTLEDAEAAKGKGLERQA